MAFNKNKKKKIFSDINITPLTDIFLVLLIIMMIIAPSFKSADNNIDIPEVDSGITIEEAKVTVEITKDGQMFLNEESVTSSNLTDKLLAVKPAGEAPEVVVKADKSVKSSIIMDVMDAAQNAEYKKLVVAGEPLNRKEQKKLIEQNETKMRETEDIR